jgi:spore coat polysaccharide biosynthesis protein SpsF (cytidylyltransferase family)
MITAIIQARQGSSRLPDKVLKQLGNKTVLEQVINRVQRCKLVDKVYVATTISERDLPIVNLCSSRRIGVFCGSENDVLDRYYQLAKLITPEHIVRITSDCPLIDSDIIDYVIKKHIDNNCDYTSNTLKETFPDGLDVEVFKFEVLCTAWQKADLTSEREHVTPFIKNRPEIFKQYSVESEVNYSNKRWTLDTDKDYSFLQKIFDGLYSPDKEYFSFTEILDYINSFPEIERINSGIIRNEGYLISLQNDSKIKTNNNS